MRNKWQAFEQETGLSVARDVSLRRFSSLGIGGLAAGAVMVETAEAIKKVYAAAEGLAIPVKIIGGGTNVVFTDAGFSGLLVRLGEGFKKIDVQGNRMTAGAAVHLAAIITKSMEAGLAGVEKLAGIPGTLGGAIHGNSGNRDYWTSKAVSAVTFWDARGNTLKTLPAGQLEFGYRQSLFQKIPAIVLSAEFSLTPAPRENLVAEVNERMHYRSATQPVGRSVGCIFKNMKDRSAGQLIDEAGLKGRAIGGLAVSDIHGNFFLNDGRATFRDFEELVKIVQTEVEKKFGTHLELEVEIVKEQSATAKGPEGAENAKTENRSLRRWKVSGEGNFV